MLGTALSSMSMIQAPPMMPIDVTEVLAVLMGMLVVLIPIAGVTARFALKPIAEAVARVRESQRVGEEIEMMGQRLSLLEGRLSGLETEVEGLAEGVEFDRQLRSGAAGDDRTT